MNQAKDECALCGNTITEKGKATKFKDTNGREYEELSCLSCFNDPDYQEIIKREKVTSKDYYPENEN